MRDYILQNTPANELYELEKRIELSAEDIKSLNKDQEHHYKEFDYSARDSPRFFYQVNFISFTRSL